MPTVTISLCCAAPSMQPVIIFMNKLLRRIAGMEVASNGKEYPFRNFRFFPSGQNAQILLVGEYPKPPDKTTLCLFCRTRLTARLRVLRTQKKPPMLAAFFKRFRFALIVLSLVSFPFPFPVGIYLKCGLHLSLPPQVPVILF